MGPATLAVTGGVTPYSWAVTPGSLPAGLSLSTAGVITGTPTAYGTFDFTVTVTDAESPAMTASKPLSITIKPAPLAITTTSLPAATGGAAYSATLAATGGVTPYAWSVTAGSLPPGLTLNASTGAVDLGERPGDHLAAPGQRPDLRGHAGDHLRDGPVLPGRCGGLHGHGDVRREPAVVEFVRPGEIGVISPPGSGTVTVTVTVTVGRVSSQATAADQFTYASPLFGGFVP